MKIILVLLLVSVAIFGCAYNPIPKPYTSGEGHRLCAQTIDSAQHNAFDLRFWGWTFSGAGALTALAGALPSTKTEETFVEKNRAVIGTSVGALITSLGVYWIRSGHLAYDAAAGANKAMKNIGNDTLQYIQCLDVNTKWFSERIESQSADAFVSQKVYELEMQVKTMQEKINKKDSVGTTPLNDAKATPSTTTPTTH